MYDTTIQGQMSENKKMTTKKKETAKHLKLQLLTNSLLSASKTPKVNASS